MAASKPHLEATAAWLVRSMDHGRGGSCAYWSPAGGWSRPYPETTGYLIPTLLSLSRALPSFAGEERAVALGRWLLEIQGPEGWWRGGLHPPSRRARPSVFNTAQVLQGLVALHELSGEESWLEGAVRGGRWLVSMLGEDDLWPGGDYRALKMPSYYTYAAWPLLRVAVASGDREMRERAEGVLAAIVTRRRADGSFPGWGFGDGGPAFTHTIAYTLQGLLESARLLGEWGAYGAPAELAVRELARLGGADGRLPGRLREGWVPAARSVCLTGNAQAALCVLELNRRRPDPVLQQAVAALVDFVCRAQRLRAPPAGARGGVGGSRPLWGRYMSMRYPNWAAKFHCDAVIGLDVSGISA